MQRRLTEKENCFVLLHLKTPVTDTFFHLFLFVTSSDRLRWVGPYSTVRVFTLKHQIQVIAMSTLVYNRYFLIKAKSRENISPQFDQNHRNEHFKNKVLVKARRNHRDIECSTTQEAVTTLVGSTLFLYYITVIFKKNLIITLTASISDFFMLNYANVSKSIAVMNSLKNYIQTLNNKYATRELQKLFWCKHGQPWLCTKSRMAVYSTVSLCQNCIF